MVTVPLTAKCLIIIGSKCKKPKSGLKSKYNVTGFNRKIDAFGEEHLENTYRDPERCIWYGKGLTPLVMVCGISKGLTTLVKLCGKVKV